MLAEGTGLLGIEEALGLVGGDPINSLIGVLRLLYEKASLLLW